MFFFCKYQKIRLKNSWRKIIKLLKTVTVNTLYVTPSEPHRLIHDYRSNGVQTSVGSLGSTYISLLRSHVHYWGQFLCQVRVPYLRWSSHSPGPVSRLACVFFFINALFIPGELIKVIQSSPTSSATTGGPYTCWPLASEGICKLPSRESSGTCRH